MTIFVVEDEVHAEWQGKFNSFDDAFAELQVRASVAWDKSPNRCPCVSWRACGREYAVVEFDSEISPWKEIGRTLILSVNATGFTWHDES